MGNAVSSAATASALEFLSQISGQTAIPLQDPIWKSLFAYPTPLVSFDPSEVQATIRPNTGSLVYHNSQTLNCQRLLYLLCQHLSHLSPESASIAAANAVRVVRDILKDLMEGLNATQLMAFVELPPTILTGQYGEELQAEFAGLENEGSLLKTLVGVLLSMLKPLPSSNCTPGAYLFQLEIIELLLVLASTQLYTPPGTPKVAAATQHIFLEAIISQKTLAPTVVETLLLDFISSALPPPALKLYTPAKPRGALYFVRAAASTVFWLPYTAYSYLRRYPQSNEHSGMAPIADASISLLLILNFYAPADSQADNPFRRALRTLQDADDIASDSVVDAVEGGLGGAVGNAAAVQYAALFEAVGKSLLSRETSVLLLYSLLHGTPHFNDYCMARSDVDSLLLPILELLYSARGRSANQLYMLLIILLILSQDAAFASNIHKISLKNVPFYKERQLTDTTLGSLLVVLLLRTAHYNLAQLKDVYLHTNTLATLANLAPSMTNLSSHTSQRLVHLLHLLQRRHTKLLSLEAEASQKQAQGQLPESDEERERRLLEIQLYSDFIRIVLEIINAILVNSLASNPELVYALLHRREVFEPFEQDPKYSDLMENIVSVTDYFGCKVELSVSGNFSAADISAEKVLEIIRLSSRGWRKDKLRTFPELRFTYEEEASPEDFFIPYIWSMIVSTLSIPWTLSAITAFVPFVPRTDTPSASNAAEYSVENTPVTATTENGAV